jgi:hypothetical protein
MRTFRTCIIIVISITIVNLTDAWKLVPEARAAQMISPWIDLKYLLSRDWVYSIGSWRLIAFLLSTLLILDSKNKEPLKRGSYWTLFFVFGFELYRFFLNFNKDNYFYIHLFAMPSMFVIAAIIKFDDHQGVWFEIKQRFSVVNNWYYNGWQTSHFNYLHKEMPVVKQGSVRVIEREPRPRFQQTTERQLSPIL